MIDPVYAGLTFTKDPSTSANKIMIEYVRGLGDPLVHGDVDPERIVWSRSKKKIIEQTEGKIPIPLSKLITLSEKVEKLFGGVPQDIEWAYDGRQVWIVQARPITTLQNRGSGKHYLGDPAKLFYWGPTRALPLYMSDFIEAEQQNFDRMLANQRLVDPPKTIVVFHDSQMVWLNKLVNFSEFVQSSFIEYERNRDIDRDIRTWKTAVQELDDLMSARPIDVVRAHELLVAAWRPTLSAELALYGAEAVINTRLERLEPEARLNVWGGMTLPDEPTFLQRIDIELAKTKDVERIAQKYPWIEDGYGGVATNALDYFRRRLKLVKENDLIQVGSPNKRCR